VSAAQILGAALVSLPFLVLFVLVVRDGGLEAVLFVFGGTAAIVAVSAAGVYLLTGSLQ